MRKILYSLAALAVALMTVSCLGSSKVEEDETAIGKQIYYYVADQHSLSIDPVNVAFRWGIILKEQSLSDEKNIDKLEVTIDGTKVRLKTKLFSGMTEYKNNDNGSYSLSFSGLSNGYRNGTLNIDTGGLMLDELQAGESWRMTIEEVDGFGYYFGTFFGVVKSATYTIAPNSTNDGWMITISHYKIQGTYMTSDWSGLFEVKQQGGRSLQYTKALDSGFDMSGSSSGTMYSASTPYYFRIDDAAPLHYKPSCGSSYVSTGKLTVGFDNSSMEDKTSANEAEIEFAQTATCTASVYITYDGVRKQWK